MSSKRETLVKDLAALLRRRADLTTEADTLRETREELLGKELMGGTAPDAEELRRLRIQELDLRDRIAAASAAIDRLKGSMRAAIDSDHAAEAAAVKGVAEKIAALCEARFPRLRDLVEELIEEFDATVELDVDPEVAKFDTRLVLSWQVSKGEALAAFAKRVRASSPKEGTLRDLCERKRRDDLRGGFGSRALDWETLEAIEDAEELARRPAVPPADNQAAQEAAG
jgi:hypothetical protein